MKAKKSPKKLKSLSDLKKERFQKDHKTPSTIHKALSKSGNPTLGILTAVLKAMGLRLSVERAS